MSVNKGKEIKTKQHGQIQFVWGLICTLSSVDQHQNNLSLFNIIEQINIPVGAFAMYHKENKPVLFPLQHQVILFFRRAIDPILGGEETPIDIKLSLVDSSGNQLFENLMSLKFPNNLKRMRHIISNPGFFITKPGDYVYKIQTRENNQESFGSPNEIPLEVKEIKSQ